MILWWQCATRATIYYMGQEINKKEETEKKEDSRTGDKVDVAVTINGVLVLDTKHAYATPNTPEDRRKSFPNGLNDPEEFRLMVEGLEYYYNEYKSLLAHEWFMDQLVENTNSRESI